MNRKGKRLRRQSRCGMSALELVIVTALMFPAIVALTFLGIRTLRVLFTVIGSMVGSPLL